MYSSEQKLSEESVVAEVEYTLDHFVDFLGSLSLGKDNSGIGRHVRYANRSHYAALLACAGMKRTW